ncbi:MAG: pyruvate kinase [Methylocystis sp.]|uniref:pyruvate kinase n=1 Tax=Methylocystis sp. TaxID=1911079 RepID=UPI003DA1CE07
MVAASKELAKDFVALRDEVAAIRDAVVRAGDDRLSAWGAGASDHLRNLAHYLALRSHDLTQLQLRLSEYGLSSLGRSEADVLASLDALLATLRRLCGEDAAYPPHDIRRQGEERLARACAEVFGSGPSHARIMATLASEAADDPAHVSELLEAGVDCFRINCAHDDAAAWEKMVKNIRRASKHLGRPCPVLMDIAGPKLRIDGVRAPEKYRLHPGERLRLVTKLHHGGDAAAITLTMPEVVAQLRLGSAVSFDDGKAVGVVTAAHGPGDMEIEITAARAKGLRLKPDKGVNFPATDLDLSPLTEKDLADLDVIAEHADLVGFSFVQRVEDVARLQAELDKRRKGKRPLALVLKIETPRSVRNLPELIAQAAMRNPTAVMIARGDLAVEVGFARLSEMQEEILWLCEAAHAPVIWATQVLDQMVHEGVASRPETTDAAMGQRADCVMLNKGPFLAQGVRFLRDIFSRMDRHHAKKFYRLSRLDAWSRG